MKIEDFQLKMQSKYQHEISIESSFESQLQIQEATYLQQKTDAMEDEKNLSFNIHLMLIEQLLQQLNKSIEKIYTPITQRKQYHEINAHIHEKKSESQKFDLSMNGFIQTDTQKIAIDISVSIAHTLITERNYEASHCIDPLIINFDGEIPSLSDTSFHFDIDNDGESDQISTLAQGNGFLALDRDENGTIDEGSELFGTKIGNGFAELSLFDSDNNLWIDENDPILDKLRIWVRNEDKNELLSLGELGIGAIYLGQIRSEFHYKNEQINLGELRSNGLFLYENGETGVISQIDLAKQDATSTIKDEPLANLILQS